MKRYLITGVSGFVGQHFLKYLDTVGEQIEVIGIDCTAVGYMPLNYTYRFEPVDILVADKILKIINDFQPDYLLHLAAKSSVSESLKEPEKVVVNNVSSLFGVLVSVQVAMQNRCRILVVGSSEVYAESNEPLIETSPCFPKNPYAYSKFIGETTVNMYCDRVDLDIVMTRSFMHTGPNQNEKFVVASFIKQLTEAKRQNKYPAELKTGNIDIIRDITDVRDIVRGYYLLLKHGRRQEVYNVCSGTAVSLKTIIEMASEILDIPASIVIDPQRLRSNEIKLVVGNNEKIRKETGWQPEIKLSQTLQDMIDHCQLTQ
ncbi:MAG: GDP-mannose 4,6-dehydratase [Planctomycetaceae bacterium]|jgi:GDP-4-dehydro-6-deoxy-D-mannose reductase|nr:GDP-mannose 4,6-dehydratase [Planctomycetaceae bacterium]